MPLAITSTSTLSCLAKRRSSNYSSAVSRSSNSSCPLSRVAPVRSVACWLVLGLLLTACDDGKCLWAEVDSVYRVTLGTVEPVRIAPTCGAGLGPTEGDSFELRTDEDVAEDAFCEIQGSASFPGLTAKGAGETRAYEEPAVVSVHGRRVAVGDTCTGLAYAEVTGHTGSPRLVRMFVPDPDACTVEGRMIDLACADAWPVRIEDAKGRVLADLPR